MGAVPVKARADACGDTTTSTGGASAPAPAVTGTEAGFYPGPAGRIPRAAKPTITPSRNRVTIAFSTTGLRFCQGAPFEHASCARGSCTALTGRGVQPTDDPSVTRADLHRRCSWPQSCACEQRCTPVVAHASNVIPLREARRAHLRTGAASIRGVMARTGLQQAELAALLDVDCSTLRRWRSGEVAAPHWAYLVMAKVERSAA